MSKFKILFISVGTPIPTFIKRRLHKLDKTGLVCILGITSSAKNDLIFENGGYYIIPRLILKDGFLWIKNLIRAIFLFRIFSQLWNFSPSNKFLPRSKWTLEKWSLIRILPVDIIHIQWIAHVPDYAWLKKVLNIPIIASVRGSMVTIYPFKHEGYEEKLRQAFSLSDRLHFVSKGLMDFCIKRYELNPEKCFVNYNGIDTNKFKPSQKRKGESEKIILVSVGALIWRKNFQDLIKIVQQSKYLSKIELRIIGEGDERFILEFMISKYQLNNHIKLFGKQTEEQIIEQLQEADIYLSTSYAEGLSNAVMEAAACGLPVIAFDCEGMNEIIINDESGFIIEHGRTDLFATTLDRLIEKPQLRENMGKAGRQHVEANFQEDIHVEAMIKEYQHTIEKFNYNGAQA